MRLMPMGPYPVEVELCLSAGEWRHAMRRRGPACAKEVFPASDGCVSIFKQRSGAVSMVVTFAKVLRDRTLIEKVGVVAHEATHVWQRVVEHIAEDKPGHEVEACGVQWIVQWLLEQLDGEGWLE